MLSSSCRHNNGDLNPSAVTRAGKERAGMFWWVRAYAQPPPAPHTGARRSSRLAANAAESFSHVRRSPLYLPLEMFSSV